jgi:F-type H+-transporting ATPase subunit delta
MKISKQSRRDAKQVFQACLVNGQLDEARVRQTVSLLIERKPRGHIGILTQFQRLVKLDIEKRTARVESAVELGPDVQAAVKSNLVARYGPNVTLSFAVNPALIGGLRIQVGSDVYDGSIKARLGNLQSSFQQ